MVLFWVYTVHSSFFEGWKKVLIFQCFQCSFPFRLVSVILTWTIYTSMLRALNTSFSFLLLNHKHWGLSVLNQQGKGVPKGRCHWQGWCISFKCNVLACTLLSDTKIDKESKIHEKKKFAWQGHFYQKCSKKSAG